MKFNVGFFKNGKLYPLYYDIPDIDKANALAQFAIHKKNSIEDIIVICPSRTENPVLLEKGRILDKIYNNKENGNG